MKTASLMTNTTYKTIERRLFQAKRYFEESKYTESHSTLRRLAHFIETRPNSNEWRVELFDVYSRQAHLSRTMRNFTDAVNSAKAMIKLDPKHYKGYLCGAKACEMNNDTSKAAFFYQKGLSTIEKDTEGFEVLTKSASLFRNAVNLRKQKRQFQIDVSKSLRDPICELPYADIFHLILRMLSLQDVVSCTRVSKDWRRLILDDSSLWAFNLDLSVKFHKWKFDSAFRNAIAPALKHAEVTGMIKFLKINRLTPSSEISFINCFAKQLAGRIMKLDIELETLALYSVVASAEQNLFTKLHSFTYKGCWSHDLLEEILIKVPTLKELTVTITKNGPPSWYHQELALNKMKKGIPIENNLKESEVFPLEKLHLSMITSVIGQQVFPELDMIEQHLPYLKDLKLHYRNKILPNATRRCQRLNTILHEGLSNLEQLNVNVHDPGQLDIFKSDKIKKIVFSNGWFHPEIALEQRPKNLTCETLSLTKFWASGSENMLMNHFFFQMCCGSTLRNLFLEFCSMLSIYTRAGYNRYITDTFPNLNTVSFSGSLYVTNETAQAIALSPNVPPNVILAMTNVSDIGVDLLVRAGVKTLCIQGCSVTMNTMNRHQSTGGVKFVSYPRFYQSDEITAR